MITTILIGMALWAAAMITVFVVAQRLSRRWKEEDDRGLTIAADPAPVTGMLDGQPQTDNSDWYEVQAFFKGRQMPMVHIPREALFMLRVSIFHGGVLVHVAGLQLSYRSRADFDADWYIMSPAHFNTSTPTT